jgi:hypothetical protein
LYLAAYTSELITVAKGIRRRLTVIAAIDRTARASRPPCRKATAAPDFMTRAARALARPRRRAPPPASMMRAAPRQARQPGRSGRDCSERGGGRPDAQSLSNRPAIASLCRRAGPNGFQSAAELLRHHASRLGQNVRPHTYARAKPSAMSNAPTSCPRALRTPHERP